MESTPPVGSEVQGILQALKDAPHRRPIPDVKKSASTESHLQFYADEISFVQEEIDVLETLIHKKKQELQENRSIIKLIESESKILHPESWAMSASKEEAWVADMAEWLQKNESLSLCRFENAQSSLVPMEDDGEGVAHKLRRRYLSSGKCGNHVGFHVEFDVVEDRETGVEEVERLLVKVDPTFMEAMSDFNTRCEELHSPGLFFHGIAMLAMAMQQRSNTFKRICSQHASDALDVFFDENTPENLIARCQELCIEMTFSWRIRITFDVFAHHSADVLVDVSSRHYQEEERVLNILERIPSEFHTMVQSYGFEAATCAFLEMLGRVAERGAE